MSELQPLPSYINGQWVQTGRSFPVRLVETVLAFHMAMLAVRLVSIAAGQAGANIEEVAHQRAFTTLAAQNVEIELVIQTRGPQHITEVLNALQQAGLQAQLVH